jgi:hypothetical protein
MRITSRIAAFVVSAVVMLVGVVGVAQAQTSVPGLMFPAYNPNGQYCYVARPVQGVECGDLNQQLRNAANGLVINGHAVQMYVVFVREPQEGIPSVAGTPPGGVIADAVSGTWKTKGVNAGFPANDFVMLVMTQRQDGTWFMAERWGADVNPYFSFPQMKNVLDANVATLRAGNYHDYVVNVSQQTIRAIGSAVNSANRPITTRPVQPTNPVIVHPRPVQPSAPFPWGTVLGVIVVIGLGIVVVVYFSNRGKLRREFEEAIADTKPVTDNIQTQIDTLVNSYDGMAMGKKSYTSGSESDKQYKTALLTSATYFAHADALKAHKAKIDDAVAKSNYKEALRLVNEESITITGEELAPELRTATSGKFKTETFTYKQLVAQIGAEFDAANHTFGTLYTSLNKAAENKRAIEAEMAKVDAAKTTLSNEGIAFDAFQTEYDAISSGTKAVVAKVLGDPLGAVAESEALKARVAELHHALDEVVEIKQHGVTALTTKRDEVHASLTQGAIYVTAKTEALFTTASAAVDGVSNATKGANPDWPNIAKSAVEAEKALGAVNTAIVEDNRVYETAGATVAKLREEYDAAFALTGDERVVQGPEGPRGQLTPVLSRVTALEALIHGGTKQNWADVTAQAQGVRGTVHTVKGTADAQIAEMAKYEAELQALEDKYGSIAGSSYSVRIPRTRKTYSVNVSASQAPAYATYQSHLTAAEQYMRLRRLDLYEQELIAARLQLNMVNTWMWWSLWNTMYLSNDPWAMQYAYDQGFAAGMAYDSYYGYVASQPGYVAGGDSYYAPTPVSEWTPSQPVNGASCGSSSSCSSSSGSSSSCSSSSGSSSSCSSSSSSCSSSSSSCSSSSSSCSSSSSSCSSSSSSCGSSS